MQGRAGSMTRPQLRTGCCKLKTAAAYVEAALPERCGFKVLVGRRVPSSPRWILKFQSSARRARDSPPYLRLGILNLNLFICGPRLVHPTISDHSHKKQRANPEGSALCQQERLTDRLSFSDEHVRQPTQPHRGPRERPKKAQEWPSLLS